MISFPSNTATRLGMNVLLLLGVVVALRLGQSVFIPMIVSLLLAAVLGPGALWLYQRLRFPWTLACLTAISGLIVLNLLVAIVPALAIPRLLQAVPRPGDEKRILELYNRFHSQLEKIVPFDLDPDLFPTNPDSVEKIRAFETLTDFAYREGPAVLRQIAWYATNWSWHWVLILFILFFLLLEGGMLSRRVVDIFGPSEDIKEKARTVLGDMARQVKTYLVWRTIINFGLAIVVGVVFQLAGLYQPWTWAFLLAILNYIPYLGPLVAGLFPVLDALISISPMGAVGILILYTVIIIIEGYLIVPVLMGRSMDLNATTVLLACLFWDLVWGTLGLFLAMPIMAAIKAICYHVPGWRPWANLMSVTEEEPQPVILNPNGEATPAVADRLPEPAVRQSESSAASGVGPR
jgi:AI-2 transport protein TqsA